MISFPTAKRFKITSTSDSYSRGQARIEKILKRFVTDHQSGLCEDSIISNRAIASIEDGDEAVWFQIGRELKDVGITSEMIQKHQEYITTWIKNLCKMENLRKGNHLRAKPPHRLLPAIAAA